VRGIGGLTRGAGNSARSRLSGGSPRTGL